MNTSKSSVSSNGIANSADLYQSHLTWIYLFQSKREYNNNCEPTYFCGYLFLRSCPHGHFLFKLIMTLKVATASFMGQLYVSKMLKQNIFNIQISLEITELIISYSICYEASSLVAAWPTMQFDQCHENTCLGFRHIAGCTWGLTCHRRWLET